MQFRLPSLFFILIFLGCQSVEQQHTLDQQIESAIIENEIPAISVIVISSDRILYQEAIGLKSITSSDSISIQNSFHIGSNTKAFTAMLCAILVEKGFIDWDTKIFEVFPELQSQSNTIYSSVSLKDLLNHKGGIKPFTQQEEVLSLPSFEGTSTEQRKAFVKWVLQQPSEYVGTYDYSNGGYAVAAAMIEKVTHSSWKHLMQQFVFKPLQIEADFGWPILKDSNGVWGHYQAEVSHQLKAHDGIDYQLHPAIQPAGDIQLSVLDMGKFLQNMLVILQGTPSLTPIDYALLKKSKSGYSLGWKISTENGSTSLQHYGSAGTFHSYAALAPDQNIGYAIFLNCYRNQSESAIESIQEKIKNTYLRKE